MHLVSHVEGTLAPGRSPWECSRRRSRRHRERAPKVRAMEIIDTLEPVARGPYAGCVGYVGFDGSLDTASRSAPCSSRRHGLRSAGAGIVYDSVPERSRRNASPRRGLHGGDRAGRRTAGGRDAAHDRQLRLLHLQPRPVPRRVGRRARGLPERRDHGEEIERLSPAEHRRIAGARHSERCGRLRRGDPAVRGRDPDPRRLSRTSGHRRGLSADSRARDGAVHGKTAWIFHDGTDVFAGCEPL